MVEMELVGVRVELPTNAPIVLLREKGGDRRLLPIFIGAPEATAIAFALEDVETPRPMTHDLMKDVLDELGVTVEQIVVTALKDATFYAELHLTAAGRTHQVSSRPSDAVALAARTGSPIFAAEAVLDEAAYAVSEEDEEEEQEVVEQFKEFIDNVNPEDFAS
ncbi:MAG: bifunctional nuclease family protein [Acidimicrobiales bacterium]|nr:bifunctional nuclease family protein [Acidimicrobiales bacterium]